MVETLFYHVLEPFGSVSKTVSIEAFEQLSSAATLSEPGSDMGTQLMVVRT